MKQSNLKGITTKNAKVKWAEIKFKKRTCWWVENWGKYKYLLRFICGWKCWKSVETSIDEHFKEFDFLDE